MPTLMQLTKKCRVKKPKKSRTKSLENSPQRKGVCLRALTTSPKKPNSGVRKIAKIRLSNGKKVTAYIPGQGHNIQQHSIVMVRGGRVKDIPGMHYKLVRGCYDFDWRESITRTQSRSKYGKPKNS